MWAGEIKRGNFVLKRLTLENTHLIWLTPVASCWLQLYFIIQFWQKKRTADLVPHHIHQRHIRKGSVYGQYGQEKWLQQLITQCTYHHLSIILRWRGFKLMEKQLRYEPPTSLCCKASLAQSVIVIHTSNHQGSVQHFFSLPCQLQLITASDQWVSLKVHLWSTSLHL